MLHSQAGGRKKNRKIKYYEIQTQIGGDGGSLSKWVGVYVANVRQF